MGKCLHLEYFLRLVASGALRAKLDLLPVSIWLFGVNKLVSATIGRCNKKSNCYCGTGTGAHKQTGNGSLLIVCG